MPIEARYWAGAVGRALSKFKLMLASSAHDCIEARARRRDEEREFYRKLRAYCRANGISAACEDDWKTRA